jgi:NADP-dependent 3-hydroxy acid dehydrogenase YdfG
MSVAAPNDRAVTVISGGTGGIGRAVARALSGDELVLLGRNDAQLAEAGREHPGALVRKVDYLSESSIAEAFQDLDRIDRLVHCTGVVATGPIAELNVSRITEMMNANFLAPYSVTQAALHLLRRARGMVVFVNSGAGKRVRPGWAGYAASKFAARALAEGLAGEEPDLRVLSIFSGPVDTPMRASLGEERGLDYQSGDYLSPDEVASLVSYATRTRSDVVIREVDIRTRDT